MLIVDTEGLRAPELNGECREKHDNELATFVIGIADVTLINVDGEVPGEIEDILQISVYAFLRMTLAKVHPSCQFVFQNTNATTQTKGEIGRLRFKEKLDLITTAAAKQVGCCNGIKSFSDVIFFDLDKDVHFFSGLWHGNYPMVSVHRDYSVSAMALKSYLLKKSSAQVQPNTLLQFLSRLKSLWNAILAENFVFNFKNASEIAAYSDVNSKFFHWERQLEREIYDWEIKIENR